MRQIDIIQPLVSFFLHGLDAAISITKLTFSSSILSRKERFHNWRPPLREEGDAGWRNPHKRTAAQAYRLDQSAIVRVLPNRQPWTRCTPCVHRVLIAPFPACDPLEEIEDQGFHYVSHNFTAMVPVLSIYPA
jgi:hypothetical protein